MHNIPRFAGKGCSTHPATKAVHTSHAVAALRAGVTQTQWRLLEGGVSVIREDTTQVFEEVLLDEVNDLVVYNIFPCWS